MTTTEKIRERVFELLSSDASGHGADHIERVVRLSVRFAKAESADVGLTELIALLHDVDDYKLFGVQGAASLTNARTIMDEANISTDIQERVLSQIAKIGYNKRLSGICPTTLEGMIVSDADMCDALGVNGIIRAYRYSVKDGKPFFDKARFPIEDMTPEVYKTHDADSTVCHIFEKILKLRDLMLTESGRREAYPRHEIVVDMLRHLFDEENAPDWPEYLNKNYN